MLISRLWRMLRYYTIILLFMVTACTTVPETGRYAFNLFPQQQLDQEAENIFQQYKQHYALSNNATWQQQVDRVGANIVNVASRRADIPPLNEWEFIVFEDDDMINAFALPGGKVAVFSGMMNLVANDDELAVIIGHEVAHVVARHGNERISQQVLAGSVAQSLGNSAATSALQLGVIMPFSRKHESEADHIGLIYLYKAGYDPYAAITFWQKMAQVNDGKEPPQFLSTHPANSTRIEDLRELISEITSEHS